jgi:hypothetical protein
MDYYILESNMYILTYYVVTFVLTYLPHSLFLPVTIPSFLSGHLKPHQLLYITASWKVLINHYLEKLLKFLSDYAE